MADHVHELSDFGNHCWICGVRKKWWFFWRRWDPNPPDHDEPF